MERPIAAPLIWVQTSMGVFKMKTRSIENHNLENSNTELRYGKMKTLVKYGSCVSLLAMFMLPVTPTQAAVFVQCPGDNDGDAQWESNGETQPPNTKCIHLSSSDGYANMGDGYLQYIFGYGDLTGTLPEDAMDVGILTAQTSAPTIVLDEGDEFYLSLTNTGMVMRPDLFDTHTVHFHGFPNASSVFDGVPDTSVSVNMGATLTYYYNIVEPGTYLYHCHVEAAEHMQMGMQGNLYVNPAQNENWAVTVPTALTEGVPHPDGSGRLYTQFAYNDGDGSTGYDQQLALQLTGFDPIFHDASKNTQPLPFADMVDTYHMFNGRGYPMTVQDGDYYVDNPGAAQDEIAGYKVPLGASTAPFNTQPLTSRKEVEHGEKLLLRITNLSITECHTISVLGLPMEVIARGGRELKDKYLTSSVNLCGGEAYDVIVDTAAITFAAGDATSKTFFVYITELDELSNNEQSFGGPMTEIVVTPPTI